MKVAFHFNANAALSGSYRYDTPIEEKCFRILLEQDPALLDFKIFCGDLHVRGYIGDAKERNKIIRGLLEPPQCIWKSVRRNFRKLILSHDIYVLTFEGMGKKIRDVLHTSLMRDKNYFGALQVDETNPVHRRLYSLVPRYRLYGRELRFLYYEGYEGDDHDTSLVEYWRSLPFSQVKFEDLGVRHTVFDKYYAPEYAHRAATLRNALVDYYGDLVDRALYRLSDLEPQLSEMLYSAFQRIDRLEASEDLAQAAVSCRRILVTLADVIYPPRKGLVEGHKVTKQEYRNRLLAYISEHLTGRDKALVLSELDAIDKRVKKLDDMANKGIHDKVSFLEARDLFFGVIILLHDLLMLAPPLYKSRVPPDEDIVEKIMGHKK